MDKPRQHRQHWLRVNKQGNNSFKEIQSKREITKYGSEHIREAEW